MTPVKEVLPFRLAYGITFQFPSGEQALVEWHSTEDAARAAAAGAAAEAPGRVVHVITRVASCVVPPPGVVWG